MNNNARSFVNGWDYVFLAFVPIAVNAPSFPILRGVSAVASLIAFGLAGFVALRLMLLSAGSHAASRAIGRQVGSFFTATPVLTLFAMVLCLSVAGSMARGAYVGKASPFSAITFLCQCGALLLYGYTISRLVESDAQRLIVVSWLGVGVGAYCAANLIGLWLGMRGGMEFSEVGLNKTLATFGIRAWRVAFPFAAGINGAAITAGFGALICVGAAIKSSGLMRGAMIASAAPCIAVVVMVDSRAAIIAALAAVAMARFFSSSRVGLAASVATIAIIAAVPYVVPSVLRQVDETGILDSLKRQDAFSKTMGVASGRDVVWGAVVSKVVSPPGALGYGYLGHAVSGASSRYSWVFAESGASSHSVHNAPLQFTIDMGVIGLIAWASFWLASTASMRRKTVCSMAMAPALLFVMFMGATEVAGTLYSFDSLQYIVLCAAVLSGRSAVS